jgi:hypothetical protein
MQRRQEINGSRRGFLAFGIFWKISGEKLCKAVRSYTTKHSRQPVKRRETKRADISQERKGDDIRMVEDREKSDGKGEQGRGEGVESKN